MRTRLSERAEVGAIVALVLAMGLMASTANSNEVSRAEKQERFERLDINGDGVLNREEHYAAARTSRYDTDGDGEISERELIAARETQRARGGVRRAELLRKYDKDGDGKLSVEEANTARKVRRSRGRHALGMGGGRLQVRRGVAGGYRVGRRHFSGR